jgi:hypothetical protein
MNNKARLEQSTGPLLFPTKVEDHIGMRGLGEAST